MSDGDSVDQSLDVDDLKDDLKDGLERLRNFRA